MQQSDTFRVIIYAIIALVYLSESRLSKFVLPETLNVFLQDYRAEIMMMCYSLIAYYYLCVERT